MRPHRHPRPERLLNSETVSTWNHHNLVQVFLCPGQLRKGHCSQRFLPVCDREQTDWWELQKSDWVPVKKSANRTRTQLNGPLGLTVKSKAVPESSKIREQRYSNKLGKRCGASNRICQCNVLLHRVFCFGSVNNRPTEYSKHIQFSSGLQLNIQIVAGSFFVIRLEQRNPFGNYEGDKLNFINPRKDFGVWYCGQA